MDLDIEELMITSIYIREASGLEKHHHHHHHYHHQHYYYNNDNKNSNNTQHDPNSKNVENKLLLGNPSTIHSSLYQLSSTNPPIAMAAFALSSCPETLSFGRSGYNKDGDNEDDKRCFGRSGYNKDGENDDEKRCFGRSGYNKDGDDENDKGRSGYN
ncbi:hypothetical protein F4825DRAFT_452139 [Nemania diffusa]|nr:hypothetical protein F4825DRAFT_452139 [Nemania diffusa]